MNPYEKENNVAKNGLEQNHPENDRLNDLNHSNSLDVSNRSSSPEISNSTDIPGKASSPEISNSTDIPGKASSPEISNDTDVLGIASGSSRSNIRDIKIEEKEVKEKIATAGKASAMYPKAKKPVNARKFLFLCTALSAVGFILAVSGTAMGGVVSGIRLSTKGLRVYAPSLEKDGRQESVGETQLEPFDRIEIALDYADVRIVSIAPTDKENTGNYAVSYAMDQETDFKYEVSDRKLTIRQEDPFNLFYSGGMGFSFGNHVKEQKRGTVVYVPETETLKEVIVNTDSGNILCDAIQTDRLKVSADYGEVTLQNTKAGDMELDLESGTLRMEHVQGKTCDIDSEYGDVILSNVSLSEDMKLDLESGNVKCQGASVRDLSMDCSYGNFAAEDITMRNLSADMESGDCTVQKAVFENCEMDMEYGNVKMKLSEPLEEYGYHIKTEYGDITVQGENFGETFRSLFEEKNKMIKIVCESGDVVID